MARKFSELEAKMSPASISRSDAAYRRLKQEMALEELRGERSLRRPARITWSEAAISPRRNGGTEIGAEEDREKEEKA